MLRYWSSNGCLLHKLTIEIAQSLFSREDTIYKPTVPYWQCKHQSKYEEEEIRIKQFERNPKSWSLARFFYGKDSENIYTPTEEALVRETSKS